jgi:nucleotide-binding universal stress UspA family protein
MYRKILVPLDGSTFGEFALPPALAVAGRAGAALHLVHVHVPVASAFTGGELAADLKLDATLREQDRKYLEHLAGTLGSVSRVPVTFELMEGAVAEVLCQHASAPETDLIVMTTHGRGPFSRFWLGSVADQLVRWACVPLLLVRPQEGKPDLAAGQPFRRIVVPLDGSPLAEQILETAAEFAGLMGAEVTLLRVIKPQLEVRSRLAGHLMIEYGEALLQQLRQIQDQLETEAQTYLDRVAQRLRARSFLVRTRVVAHDRPATAILEETQAEGADLVALETHGRGGLARLFLGSVADKVLRGGSTAVLIHRAPAHAGKGLDPGAVPHPRQTGESPGAGPLLDVADLGAVPGCCHSQRP